MINVNIISLLQAAVVGLAVATTTTTAISTGGDLFSELANCPSGLPVLFEKHVDSRGGCALLCLSTAGCMRMAYRSSEPTPGTCRGYRSLVVITDAVTIAVGFSTFVKTCSVSGTPVEVARGRPASQISTLGAYVAGRAVDGNLESAMSRGSCSHTAMDAAMSRQWWQVDIGRSHRVVTVRIVNRLTFGERLKDFDIRVYSEDPVTNPSAVYGLCHHYAGYMGNDASEELACYCAPCLVGQFVRVVNAFGVTLALCEVQVMAIPLEP